MSLIREALGKSLPISESSKNIVKYAKIPGPESTKKLREEIRSTFKFKGIDLPYFTLQDVSDPKTFTKIYNELLKNPIYRTMMEKIFNFHANVGRGEILLAYLHEDMSVGGTGQSYDIDFGKKEIEVKEVKISKNYGGNFRLGVDSSNILKIAYSQLSDLYDVAKHHIPSINNIEFENNVHKKGGIALKELRNWKIPKDVVVKELKLKVLDDGYIFQKGRVIGNLKDKDIIKKIRGMFSSPEDLKSFNQIERELEKEVSSHKMSYFFFGSIDKGIPLYYKDKIDEIRIESATNFRVKFQVKLD